MLQAKATLGAALSFVLRAALSFVPIFMFKFNKVMRITFTYIYCIYVDDTKHRVLIVQHVTDVHHKTAL